MIKKICFVLMIAFLISSIALGQETNGISKGVTVIAHGFALGGFNTDFVEFGKEINAASGGLGTVYLLNGEGQFEKVEGSGESNEEIVIVYDWADLATNFLRQSKYGDLESAADFLFAALMAPPQELGISGDQLLQRPLHFIGHSRGAILLMQLCHRIKRYKPNIRVEQLTLLDPHPATPFGDVGGFINGDIPSLPCVSGVFTLGSGLFMVDQSIELSIPENVTFCDGYFRKDNQYEELVSNLTDPLNYAFASFDGVQTRDNFNHNILNDDIISELVSSNEGLLGGAHSAVVKWYRGTIPNSQIVANNGSWYSPFVGAFFGDNDSRYSVGFIHSRIGSKGDDDLLPPVLPQNLKASIQEMNDAINNRQGFGGGIQRVFNGSFQYGSAGWRNRGGNIDEDADRTVTIQNVKYYNLPHNDNLGTNYHILKHNYFYFGRDELNNSYQSLRFTCRYTGQSIAAGIKIIFYDFNDNVLDEHIIQLEPSGSAEKIIKLPIPLELRNATGTFSVENLTENSLYLGRFDLTTSSDVTTNTTSLAASFVRAEQAVHLDWSDFTIDETGYTIERGISEDGPFDHLVGTLPPNSNFIEDTLLAPNVTYWYRVKSESATVQDAYTNIESITIAEKPPAPTSITAAVFNNKDIEVSWNDETDVETSYELYYKIDNGGGFSLLKSLPANTTSYTIVNVPSNTTISFYVQSKELKFLSEHSPEVSATVGSGSVISRIAKVEAFIDNDPGFGKAIPLSGDFTNSDVLATKTIPVTDLTVGLHTMYIRSLDTKGYWSNTHINSFLKLSIPEGGVKLNELQYSINAKSPGAIWKDVYIGPQVNTSEGITVTIAPLEISSLPDGIHFITIRAKDNQGFYSNYFHQSFLKLAGTGGNKKVISLEYSIDNGLLIGTGTAVTLTPGKYANVSIDLPALANGKHYISLKAKDDGGYPSNITIDSFVVRDQSFCEKNSIVYFRSLINNAKTYTWQQNDGSGWITLSNNESYTGTRTQVLALNYPPTSWYGYQFRCIVNGVPTQPFILKFSDTWTGSQDDDWHNPNNWCCFGVPDKFTDVIIDPTVVRKPRISTTAVCRSLLLKPNSNITVGEGVSLEIMGQ